MRPAPAVVRTASRAPWFGALLGLCVALGLGAPARAQVPQTPQTTTTPSTPAEGAEAEQAKPAVPVALLVSCWTLYVGYCTRLSYAEMGVRFAAFERTVMLPALAALIACSAASLGWPLR